LARLARRNGVSVRNLQQGNGAQTSWKRLR